jgi:hypothetical protein
MSSEEKKKEKKKENEEEEEEEEEVYLSRKAHSACTLVEAANMAFNGGHAV